MLGYNNPQQCDIKSKCEYDICCYECDIEVCEYRCHISDDKDFTKCKHAEICKIVLD